MSLKQGQIIREIKTKVVVAKNSSSQEPLGWLSPNFHRRMRVCCRLKFALRITMGQRVWSQGHFKVDQKLWFVKTWYFAHYRSLPTRIIKSLSVDASWNFKSCWLKSRSQWPTFWILQVFILMHSFATLKPLIINTCQFMHHGTLKCVSTKR